MGLTLLTVPGYTGSGPGHWQSLWEASDPSMGRIQQANWDEFNAGQWTAAIDAAVRAAGPRTVLVAHSGGALAVAHWAARHERPVAGAFLVAPPDCHRPNLDAPVRAFGLPRVARLPFPAMVVASEDDPYCPFRSASDLARGWGATLVSAGAAGHLNTASGHGPWPEGRTWLAEFCARLQRG
jgi:uncharacterized protein